MPLDVDALRESFALAVERAPDLTRRFYEILFERYPSVRPMFGASLKKQEEMLTRALVAVLDHAEDEAWLGETLRALGAKHVGYGVTDAMYPWVGDALLGALSEVAGDAWTPRFEKAWSDAYGAISGLMMEGARAAVAGADDAPPAPGRRFTARAER
jgi:hemoglobin-like flavoprotein